MGQKHGIECRGEGRGDTVSGPSPFDDLPEECISNIISLTSPRDACVAASVSKTFGSAVDSDVIWEKFLPPEYASLILGSRVFTSKKELYFALCDHFLIEDGKKSFWLDKASGKKCIMLSAKELTITWGNSPQHWRWISILESTFEKVAELLNVWWFEIRGKMKTRLLSPGTRYSAYIVFETVDKCPGLADLPVEVGVGLVGQKIRKQLIYFDGYMDNDSRKERGETRDIIKPNKREDGWMEAELGEFFNEESCDEIELSVIEIKSPYWKCGLIIEGIEFRPTKNQFDKVPKLVFGCPFKIDGVMKARFLSPGTRYSAYVVYKAKDKIPDIRKDIGVGLIDYGTSQGQKWVRQELTKLEKREDGWMEVKFGEFLNERGLMASDEIDFHIREIKYTY